MNKGVILIIAILSGLFHGQTSAQNGLFQGVYISAHLPYQNTQGGLNGNSVLVTPSEVFLVPQVDGGAGFGFGIGVRYEGNVFEFTYDRTAHLVTFAGAEGKALLRVYSLDYLYFFNRNSPVQPYIQFGWLPGMSLKVFDASASIANSEDVRDARIVGSIGTIHAGLGTGFFILPRLEIRGGVTYRMGKYTGVVGGKDIVAAHIEEPIRGNGLNARVSLNVLLSKPKSN